MAHQLGFIKSEHIHQAIQKIDNGIVPKNNEWSEYWINYKGKLYQFKYIVEVASTFTQQPIITTDFRSNKSSRNYVAKLGFHIIFKTPTVRNTLPKFWVGASYYGLPGAQTDMIDDFRKNNYWRTDHNLTRNEGLKVYNLLQSVKVNDRFCIRYLDKKAGKVQIALIGTVFDISGIKDGRLGVKWDYNPPEFRGKKPSGVGSGNWWKTLFRLKKHTDITLIFGETLIEKRVARVAWNDFGWVMPSGVFGKSEHKDSHEAKYGYGHEEWLFDTGKLINGYHYGFLEPIRKEQEAFAGRTYDVWLYSINGETKKRFWIGSINKLIVIDKGEADDVKQTYVDKGWLDEMTEQIKASGANEIGFSDWKGVDLFNVKFRPGDIFVNDPYFELSDTHPIKELSRYAFAHFKDEFVLTTEQATDDFAFTPPTDTENEDDDKAPKSKTYTRQPKTVEILYLHRAISSSLTKTLRQKYGKENVKREHFAGYGANQIDIVVSDNGELIFYEIKTYNSLRTSIREAFGQLMEYCFYPDKLKAKELIIVTQLAADSETIIYFKLLRDRFNLPIYYQSYDLDTETLSEKF